MVVPAVIVGTTTTRFIQGHANWASTELSAIKVLDSPIRILSVQVFKNSLTRIIAINVSKRDTPRIAAEVLQVLPAGVPRNARDCDADAGRPTRPSTAVSTIIKDFATRSAFFCKFNDNACPHERFPVEVMNCVLGVLRGFKFNEAETSHNAAVNNAAIAFKELVHIV